jgi:hypothetical protein
VEAAAAAAVMKESKDLMIVVVGEAVLVFTVIVVGDKVNPTEVATSEAAAIKVKEVGVVSFLVVLSPTKRTRSNSRMITILSKRMNNFKKSYSNFRKPVLPISPRILRKGTRKRTAVKTPRFYRPWSPKTEANPKKVKSRKAPKIITIKKRKSQRFTTTKQNPFSTPSPAKPLKEAKEK